MFKDDNTVVHFRKPISKLRSFQSPSPDRRVCVQPCLILNFYSSILSSWESPYCHRQPWVQVAQGHASRHYQAGRSPAVRGSQELDGRLRKEGRRQDRGRRWGRCPPSCPGHFWRCLQEMNWAKTMSRVAKAVRLAKPQLSKNPLSYSAAAVAQKAPPSRSSHPYLNCLLQPNLKTNCIIIPTSHSAQSS